MKVEQTTIAGSVGGELSARVDAPDEAPRLALDATDAVGSTHDEQAGSRR